jgi:hypothetical protein
VVGRVIPVPARSQARTEPCAIARERSSAGRIDCRDSGVGLNGRHAGGSGGSGLGDGRPVRDDDVVDGRRGSRERWKSGADGGHGHGVVVSGVNGEDAVARVDSRIGSVGGERCGGGRLRQKGRGGVGNEYAEGECWEGGSRG